jgi:hypothetical protein
MDRIGRIVLCLVHNSFTGVLASSRLKAGVDSQSPDPVQSAPVIFLLKPAFHERDGSLEPSRFLRKMRRRC